MFAINDYKNWALNDQRTALAQNGVEFPFRGGTIPVRPHILKFNFGVNEGAVNTLGRALPNIAGGWDLSKQMNKTAIEARGVWPSMF